MSAASLRKVTWRIAADTARTQFNVTGAGVKVAVLSDSVDHWPASQASGDLGTVTVLRGAERRAGQRRGNGHVGDRP